MLESGSFSFFMVSESIFFFITVIYFVICRILRIVLIIHPWHICCGVYTCSFRLSGSYISSSVSPSVAYLEICVKVLRAHNFSIF